MDAELQSAIERAIHSATGKAFSIGTARAVAGGCIHRALVLDDGTRRFFAKTNDRGYVDALAAEADGLVALCAAGVRVPQPIAHGATERHAWLVLEHLVLRRGDGAAHARLGRALAALHSTKGESYGWARDNYIGATAQRNRRQGEWKTFWLQERLQPQLELAAQDGHRQLALLGESLCGRLDRLLAGHSPAPALLHGDLWSGNAGFLADGMPVLFDPAVYYGDREADLAMSELFGGFPASFYDAYREAAPLGSGYAVRKTLYNLYHVLNHAHLFGGGYPAQAERMMRQLLAETR